MIGQSVPRQEDRRLLTGKGHFVEDIMLPDMVHMAFVRSPFPHARINKVDAEAALALPGVLTVLTHESWPEFALSFPTFPRTVNAAPYQHEIEDPPTPDVPILGDRVTFVGDIVAVVVARDRYVANDALELIDVDFEALPVATWEGAVRGEAPPVHPGHDNVDARMKYMSGEVDAALARADHVLERVFTTPSQKSMAIECRGVLAQWDESIPVMNIWSTVAAPYFFRDAACRVLGLASDQVRIMSRDIGGNFGAKGRLRPEDMICTIASFKLGRPVRWIETRLEHMTASPQNGRQRHEVKAGFDAEGRILAIDLKLQKEVGAVNHFATLLPVNTVNHLTGQFKVPNIRFECQSLMTHTVPCAPYRGAGRVEAVFTMDRILDGIARTLKLDPLEVRRRNLVMPEDLPYRTGMVYRNGLPVTFDTHNFALLLDTAVERSDYHQWRDKQTRLRAEGRAIGIGISSYVDAGGIGPSEAATIRIDGQGRARVFIGVNSQGQSHETTLAQVCAGILGLPMKDVAVIGGDTNAQPIGFGTGGSRVAINAGNAIHKATLLLRRKILDFGAMVLGCGADELELADGVVRAKPPRQNFIPLERLAQMALRDPRMAGLGGPGLTATDSFYPGDVVWSCGANIAVVEVDKASGDVKILKYVFVHDIGEPLNPAVVDGQIHGGVAQGLSVGLGEQMVYDEDGQPISGSFMDYYVPRAADIPDIELEHMVFPTTANPLGIKSVGESGPNSPPAVLAAAVEDALEGHIEITALPIGWGRILKALKAMEAGRAC